MVTLLGTTPSVQTPMGLMVRVSSILLLLDQTPPSLADASTSDPDKFNVIGFIVVLAAAASDVLDGFIARVSGTVSHIGLILDPLCDKLFVILALSAFLVRPELDWASFLILILRDLFTTGSYLVARLVGLVVPFRPRWAGKTATGLQLLALLALIFEPRYVPLLVLLVGVVSVYATIDYGQRALKRRWKGAAA